jgi:L-galactose dehydrogenase
MEMTTLGRSGLRVSRMGLGCGGHSRLGLTQGGSEADAERVVREAIDLGVNLIDTAESYGTEEVVGRAIRGHARSSLVVSTKVGVRIGDRVATPQEMRDRLEGCLHRLGTDTIDIFHLHGVSAADYPHARDVLAPVLHELKAEGKVRAVGITEAFAPDPTHKMLSSAVQDGVWDIIMVGFNLLNQSARTRVLAATRAAGIGTLCMFAVRRALSRPEALRTLMADLAHNCLVDAPDGNEGGPLSFLTDDGVAASVQEAAYRFCLWEPGIDAVLSGTGSVEHLRENAASLSGPPLPEAVVDRLTHIFRRVDSVSGN